MAQRQRDEERWARYMAGAHRGDTRLYEQLLREMAKVIELYIQRRFGSLSFAEDCVQECLLAIHSGRHTYDPRRPFRPWFFTIVRNKTVDLLRRSYTASRRADELESKQFEAYEADPAEELAAGDLLTQLDPMYRNALALTKIDGYSLSEAAERTGISEAAMKSRVARALKATEELLRQERSYE